MNVLELLDTLQRARAGEGSLASDVGDLSPIVNGSGTEQVVSFEYDAANARVIFRSGNAVPAQVATPRAAAIAATAVTVAWDAPDPYGRPAVTDYDVRYRAGSSGGYTDATHTGTGRSIELTGLTTSQAYEVQVRAVNAIGNGAWSAALTVTPAP